MSINYSLSLITVLLTLDEAKANYKVYQTKDFCLE